jgi:hypothetical protein
MQFEPATWARFGIDANGDGVRDPYDPEDAIFGAAPPDFRPERAARPGGLRFLFPSQIGRLTMSGVARRTVQHRLGGLHKQGLAQRLQPNTAKGGQNQRIYALTCAGFEAARAQRGPYIGAQEGWSDFEATDPRRILHDLHANAWLIAFTSPR